jgi:hypothetical protein
MDCIVSYHVNPATCGVARFNGLLAKQLGVPMIGVYQDAVFDYREPLLSFKASEFTPTELVLLEQRLDQLLDGRRVRIFLHAFTNTTVELRLLRAAAVVYCGNPEVRAQVLPQRPDALELWCPGTMLSRDRFRPVELSVLSFGMAHKVRSDFYTGLHRLLERSGKSYALYLSTALHENTSFEESFNGAFDAIRATFGNRVHFLGFLSDAAVYNYMLDSTFFAAFFETGVRSNNTSVNAAMSCGAVVITNLDDFSPREFEHGKNVLDIQKLDALPTDEATLRSIGERARVTSNEALGWPALLHRVARAESGLDSLAMPARRGG